MKTEQFEILKNNLQLTANSLPLFLVGPTATGKSSLAFKLQSEFDYDILSVDSRQVYADLEISSGADIPATFSQSSDEIGGYKYFIQQSNHVYGLSLLCADQDWSIAHFRDYAQNVINHSKEHHRNLLIVGGSGLYLQSLFLNAHQLHISPNESLRQELEQLTSVEELQEKVLAFDKHAKEKLNNSDWHNPRRLIRFYEKQLVQPNPDRSHTQQVLHTPEDYTWIGLTQDKKHMQETIELRVKQRIEQGAIQEVEQLLSRFDQKFPAMSSTGVKEIMGYLKDQYDGEKLIELWSLREFQYAKRQLTWFKKRSYIQWTDISS